MKKLSISIKSIITLVAIYSLFSHWWLDQHGASIVWYMQPKYYMGCYIHSALAGVGYKCNGDLTMESSMTNVTTHSCSHWLTCVLVSHWMRAIFCIAEKLFVYICFTYISSGDSISPNGVLRSFWGRISGKQQQFRASRSSPCCILYIGYSLLSVLPTITAK